MKQFGTLIHCRLGTYRGLLHMEACKCRDADLARTADLNTGLLGGRTGHRGLTLWLRAVLKPWATNCGRVPSLLSSGLESFDPTMPQRSQNMQVAWRSEVSANARPRHSF